MLALVAEGRGHTVIAERLFVTDGAVDTHIRSIVGKLDLAPGDVQDRRVAAVLQYLATSVTVTQTLLLEPTWREVVKASLSTPYVADAVSQRPGRS